MGGLRRFIYYGIFLSDCIIKYYVIDFVLDYMQVGLIFFFIFIKIMSKK